MGSRGRSIFGVRGPNDSLTTGLLSVSAAHVTIIGEEIMKTLKDLPRWFCKPFRYTNNNIGAKMVEMEASNAKWVKLDDVEQLICDRLKKLKDEDYKAFNGELWQKHTGHIKGDINFCPFCEFERLVDMAIQS